MSDTTDKRHELLFGVRRSIRYHYRRRAFFDRISRTAIIFTAIAGSATVAALLAKLSPALSMTCAAAVAVFSAVNLVLNPSQAARHHHDMTRSFFALEKDILATSPDSISDVELTALVARRLDIEAEETPPLKVLDCLCHNELMRAMGYDKAQMVRIRWYQRLAANFFDLCEHKIAAS